MAEPAEQQRRELLAQGRALPPEPGQYGIREGSGDDVAAAAAESVSVPESDQDRVRGHIVRWAVVDGTTDHLPGDWHIEGT